MKRPALARLIDPFAATRKIPAAHRCSFCLVGTDELERLIAGPGAMSICDQCVPLASRSIDRAHPRDSTTGERIGEVKQLRSGCDFCGKTTGRTQYGDKPAICDQCIDLCAEILAEDRVDLPVATLMPTKRR